MVGRCFRNIATQRIWRGILRSVEMLEKAIYDYIAAHNHDTKPFAGPPPICRTSSRKPSAPTKH